MTLLFWNLNFTNTSISILEPSDFGALNYILLICYFSLWETMYSKESDSAVDGHLIYSKTNRNALAGQAENDTVMYCEMEMRAFQTRVSMPMPNIQCKKLQLVHIARRFGGINSGSL